MAERPTPAVSAPDAGWQEVDPRTLAPLAASQAAPQADDEGWVEVPWDAEVAAPADILADTASGGAGGSLLRRGEQIARAAGRGFMRAVPNPKDIWDVVTESPLTMIAPERALAKAMAEGAVNEARSASQEQFEKAYASPTLAGKIGRGAMGVASAVPFIGPPAVRIGENLIGGTIAGDPVKAYEGVGETIGTVLGGVAGKGFGRATRVRPPRLTREGALAAVGEDLKLVAPPRIPPEEVGQRLLAAEDASRRASKAAGHEKYAPLDEIRVPVGEMLTDPEVLAAISVLPASALKRLPTLKTAMDTAAFMSPGRAARSVGVAANSQLEALFGNVSLPFNEAQALRTLLRQKRTPKAGGMATTEQAAFSRAYDTVDEQLKNAAASTAPELRDALLAADANWRTTVGNLFNSGRAGAIIRGMAEAPEFISEMLMPRSGHPAPITRARRVAQLLDQGEQLGTLADKVAVIEARRGIQNQLIHQHVLKAPEGSATSGSLIGAGERITALGPIKNLLFDAKGREQLGRLATLEKAVTTLEGHSSFHPLLKNADFAMYVASLPYKYRLVLKALSMWARRGMPRDFAKLIDGYRADMKLRTARTIQPPPSDAPAMVAGTTASITAQGLDEGDDLSEARKLVQRMGGAREANMFIGSLPDISLDEKFRMQEAIKSVSGPGAMTPPPGQ